MCLVFLTFLLAPPPAQAQYQGDWTVTDQNGNSLSQNNDGSYTLMGAVAANGTNTYPSDMDPDYFYTACVCCPDYYPNLFNGTPLPYLSPGVGVGGWVNNCAPGLGDQYWNGTTDEDINGTVNIDASVPLIAIFQYTGTGTPPP